DKVTGRMMDPIRTLDIYRGAAPFVGLQILMIAAVIVFPGMVMHYKGPVVDTSNIQIQIPMNGGGLGGGLGGDSQGGFGSLGGLGGAPFAPQPTPAAPGAPADAAAPAPSGGMGLGLGGPPPGLTNN
ncbi:MAG: C4-dicarboxylate ABC transporter, partial [Paracoccus sp. (in: a-proteobacteria)]